MAYVLAYGLLRTTHLIIHEGAFYENGIKKFYEHRMEMESTLSFLFPVATGVAKVIFTPAMAMETLFWNCAIPVLGRH